MIVEVWSKIERWLKAKSPAALASFRGPASPEELAKLEKDLGFPVPAELREFLAVRNGQAPESLCGTLRGWIFLGAAGIGKFAKTMARLKSAGDFEDQQARGDGKVKSDWWNERWVPFLESPGGDYLCVDMDPDANGKACQIIEFCHDYEKRSVEAGSLEELLKEFGEDLEGDNYTVEDDGNLQLN